MVAAPEAGTVVRAAEAAEGMGGPASKMDGEIFSGRPGDGDQPAIGHQSVMDEGGVSGGGTGMYGPPGSAHPVPHPRVRIVRPFALGCA